jgi:hypothetical protein
MRALKNAEEATSQYLGEANDLLGSIRGGGMRRGEVTREVGRLMFVWFGLVCCCCCLLCYVCFVCLFVAVFVVVVVVVFFFGSCQR